MDPNVVLRWGARLALLSILGPLFFFLLARILVAPFPEAARFIMAFAPGLLFLFPVAVVVAVTGYLLRRPPLEPREPGA